MAAFSSAGSTFHAAQNSVSGSIQSLLMRPGSLEVQPPGLLVQAGQRRRVAVALDGRFRIAEKLILEDGVLDRHMRMSLQVLRVVNIQEQRLHEVSGTGPRHLHRDSPNCTPRSAGRVPAERPVPALLPDPALCRS